MADPVSTDWAWTSNLSGTGQAVELGNDCIGCVPTEQAFGPQGGGHETRLTSDSDLEPTAGRQIADALFALSAQLTPGKVPQSALLPPFQGQPWSYGRVPPELD